MSETIELLTKPEAAAAARICVRSLEKLLAAGRGPTTTRLGGKILIGRDHLNLWLESLADTPAAA